MSSDHENKNLIDFSAIESQAEEWLDGAHVADLQELADLISERLGNPVTIEDHNHNLLSYSIHHDVTDPARRETIMNRRVPQAVISSLWEKGYIQRLMEQDDPVRIPPMNQVGLGERVAIGIRKGEEVLGYIYVLEIHRSIGKEEYVLLKKAAKTVAGMLMERRSQRGPREKGRKEFFWEILLENLNSSRSIIKKAQMLNIALPNTFLVAIIQMPNLEMMDKLKRELPYLLLTKGSLVNGGQSPLWVARENEMIVLLGSNPVSVDGLRTQAENWAREILEQWQEQQTRTKPSVALGGVSQNILEIGRSYQQALQVVKLQEMFHGDDHLPFSYDNLGIYRYLPLLMEKNKSEKYANWRLKRLIKYDRENHTDLIRTLEVFLDSAGRVNVAANRLHIHTNTLNYRLKRISEIADIDLDDANQRVALYLDIKMGKVDDSR
ncbi:helix-turn-helix domain-containing protein [Microaerobacter geothermalis]|uniref:PucR family transcriptional regulator n=1 Tax=Microaerobacter geothermalis TaxID=674972 RepID=UPI001F3F8C3C|nr:helix-turn-helix domain-containing protein [Microaerobacter geothermalis]MCF6094721.1 helix-turn-helix domain-containing protein [Microaerobacter geothermalis]